MLLVAVCLALVVCDIVEHNRRVMAREPENWSALADALGGAVKACRRQVLTVLDDVGDSGAR